MSTFEALLTDAALKSTVLLFAGLLVCMLLRRTPPAARHLVLTVADGGSMLLLPLIRVAPTLELPWARAAEPARPQALAGAQGIPSPAIPLGGAPSEPPSSPVPVENVTPPIKTGALLLSALVTVVLLGRTLLGRWMLRGLPRRASAPGGRTRAIAQELRAALRLRRGFTLLESTEVTVPMTFGTLRPVVLLPAASRSWSEERLRLVLLHELAHLLRYDTLTQLLAEVGCAVFWFQPLMWVAAHQMRRLRELACDDRVLRQGVLASRYAEALLEVSREAVPASELTHAALGMARSDLPMRLRAILEPGRNPARGPLTPLMGLTLALCIPLLAGLRPMAAKAAQAATSGEERPEDDASHLLAAVRQVRDASERGRRLRALLRTAPINAATGHDILQMASALPDRDLAKVLSQMHEIAESELVRGPLLNDYLEAAARLHSSEDLSQALVELLHPYPIPEDGTARALVLAQRLRSDSERMRVLREVSDHQTLGPLVTRAYSKVVDALSNAGDKRDAQEALIKSAG